MSASLSHRERMLKHGEQIELILAWNAKHKIGADVVYRRDRPHPPLETTTRSEAQMLGGHTAVIWLEGVAGCVALDRVKARGK